MTDGRLRFLPRARMYWLLLLAVLWGAPPICAQDSAVTVRIWESSGGCVPVGIPEQVWVLRGDEFVNGDRRLPRAALERLREAVVRGATSSIGLADRLGLTEELFLTRRGEIAVSARDTYPLARVVLSPGEWDLLLDWERARNAIELDATRAWYRFGHGGPGSLLVEVAGPAPFRLESEGPYSDWCLPWVAKFYDRDARLFDPDVSRALLPFMAPNAYYARNMRGEDPRGAPFVEHVWRDGPWDEVHQALDSLGSSEVASRLLSQEGLEGIYVLESAHSYAYSRVFREVEELITSEEGSPIAQLQRGGLDTRDRLRFRLRSQLAGPITEVQVELPVVSGEVKGDLRELSRIHRLADRTVDRHPWIRRWKAADPARVLLLVLQPSASDSGAWQQAGLRGLPAGAILLARKCASQPSFLRDSPLSRLHSQPWEVQASARFGEEDHRLQLRSVAPSELVGTPAEGLPREGETLVTPVNP